MFNVTGGEFLIIFLVALVVLGPTKLPEAARQMGKIVGEFRRISSGFQRELQSAMNDPVSKVTGEATPKTLKDVTSVAEVPPMADPATPSAGDVAETAAQPTSDAADADTPAPRKGPVFNTAAIEQTDSLDEKKPFNPATAAPKAAAPKADAPDATDPVDDPPMYGDR